MGQPRAVMIACRREEHLSLVFEPSEGLAVNDPIAIALKGGPDPVLFLRAEPAATVGALRCRRGQNLPFALLQLLADAAHDAYKAYSATRRGAFTCHS